MKLIKECSLSFLVAGIAVFTTKPVDGQGQMTKMCLFYERTAGHARSDPIINQNCPSGHVHTFYGPLNFHPNTSNDQLRNTSPSFSNTPFVENQSLYWHPTIYEVTTDGNGVKTYDHVSELVTGPYYRWDKSSPAPLVEAFPDDFRLIASSLDPGASQGGEVGDNLFTECCDYDSNGEEVCESWSGLNFPKRDCAFMGIGFSMPTCSNGQSDSPDHKSHMAYTTDGSVAGPCPQGYQAKRFPQIQLFVRFAYRGATKTYELSDGQMSFHFDFMNGWQTGKLQEIIDGCGFEDQEIGEYNPPCGCDEFLTPNTNVAPPMCESDVRRLIIDEPTSNMNSLPQGECLPSPQVLITKSWTTDPPITLLLPDQCPRPDPSPSSPTNGPPPSQPTPQPTLRPPAPTNPPPTASLTNIPVSVPEPSVGCADSSSFFFSDLNEDCAWIGANDECDLEDEEEGIPLRLFCPTSCDACDELNSLDCEQRLEICHIQLGRACVAESWNCEAECEEQDEEDEECFAICDEALETCLWDVEDDESCWSTFDGCIEI